MKILSIGGRGLASLEAPFRLDLAEGPLKEAGLFAITGPTGAGKSTLLDSLCLALFDRVPRYEGQTRVTEEGLRGNDPRQLLRHGSVEGEAECSFIGQDGEAYRARWSVRRARLRPDGKLQPQEMTLVALEGGHFIGRTKKEVLAEIEERLGLSYSQFRRALLLAQGDFAAFLSASERDRSELLERITGSELYSRIGQLAFEKASHFKERITLLQSQLKELPAIDPEELSKLHKKTKEEKEALEKLRKREQELLAAKRWVAEEAGAQARLQRAKQELQNAESAVANEKENLDTLNALHRVRPLLPAFLDLKRLRQEKEKITKEANNLGNRLTLSQKEIEQQRKEVEENNAALTQLRLLREVAIELKALSEQRSALQSQQKELLKERKQEQQASEALTKQFEEKQQHLFEKEQSLLRLKSGESLHNLRTELTEGEPCPLCGSEEHPWSAIGDASSLVRQQEAEIQASKRELRLATQQLAGRQARFELLEAQLKEGECSLGKIEKKRNTLNCQWKGEESEETWQESLALALALDASPVANQTTLSAQGTGVSVKRLDKAKEALEQTERTHALLTHQKNETEARAVELTELEKQTSDTLANSLKESDLTYEKASTLFALPADWETQQRKRWETLQGDLERAKGKESECTQRLATLHQQPTKAAQSEKELSTLLITLKKELKTVEASLASSHRRIVFEEASSERRRTLESELIKLMRESEPLLALRELIGSRDGHRFRQFAQSLSLHALLEATNYHLAEIAPRYRLEKQTESDLGLLVVDLEMGDERRLPESLSGGETFLVSLALALGLSSLSSEKTQIESLFIDEGFGTLDSESLEQALQALDQLQSHGCQVAIISHLPALIERIGCAVKVTPTRYGSSRVTVEEL